MASRPTGRFGKLRPMLALADYAFNFTFGLALTFIGIGVVANVLIVYAVVQVIGERKQNEADRRRRTFYS